MPTRRTIIASLAAPSAQLAIPPGSLMLLLAADGTTSVFATHG